MWLDRGIKNKENQLYCRVMNDLEFKLDYLLIDIDEFKQQFEEVDLNKIPFLFIILGKYNAIEVSNFVNNLCEQHQ